MNELLSLARNSIMAITPDGYETVMAVLELRANDVEAYRQLVMEARTAKAEPAADDMVVTPEGAAIIPIHGTIAPRMGLIGAMSGGATPQGIRNQVKAAMDNPDVKAAVLNVRSPGGSAEQVKATSDCIRAFRGIKPIIAHANEQMCSAGYWIPSAADEVHAFDTSIIGSIGVLTEHVDRSEADKQHGVKRTYLSSAEFKAIGNDAEPLSDKAASEIGRRLMAMHNIFTADVAINRGRELAYVNSVMADGRVHLGAEAVALGFADKLMTFDDTVAYAIEKARHTANGKKHFFMGAQAPASAGMTAGEDGANKEEFMDVATLRKEHPDVFSAVEEIGAAKATASLEAAHASALSAKAAEMEALGEKLKAADKENAMLAMQIDGMKAAATKTEASAIEDKALAASALPEKLHVKVKGRVDYAKHVNADTGAFNADSFKAAFSAEVADFEAAMPSAGVGATGGKTVGDEEHRRKTEALPGTIATMFHG